MNAILFIVKKCNFTIKYSIFLEVKHYKLRNEQVIIHYNKILLKFCFYYLKNKMYNNINLWRKVHSQNSVWNLFSVFTHKIIFLFLSSVIYFGLLYFMLLNWLHNNNYYYLFLFYHWLSAVAKDAFYQFMTATNWFE